MAAIPGVRGALAQHHRRLPGRRGRERRAAGPRRRRDEGLPGAPLRCRERPTRRSSPACWPRRCSTPWSAPILIDLRAGVQGLVPFGTDLLSQPERVRVDALRRPRPVLPAVLAALLIAIGVFLGWIEHHVTAFWDRVRHGLAILTQPRRYLREVVLLQAIGWVLPGGLRCTSSCRRSTSRPALDDAALALVRRQPGDADAVHAGWGRPAAGAAGVHVQRRRVALGGALVQRRHAGRRHGLERRWSASPAWPSC